MAPFNGVRFGISVDLLGPAQDDRADGDATAPQSHVRRGSYPACSRYGIDDDVADGNQLGFHERSDFGMLLRWQNE